MIPKAQLILGYKEVYGNILETERIELIRDIPKLDLIGEISWINFLLKPKKRLTIDSSIKLQNELLEKYAPNQIILNQYKYAFRKYSILKRNKKDYDYPLFFTRPTCLFAIEEIISNTALKNYEEDFVMGQEENWANLLKYLAAVNSELTSLKNIEDENLSLELFNVKTIALNELVIETDFMYTPYRGLKLLEYMSSIEWLQTEVKNYFKYYFDYKPDEFIYNILITYYFDSSTDESLKFYYLTDEGTSTFFDFLSQRISGTQTEALINIRKYPFYKYPNKSEYILIDSMALIEKSYSQLINDFWFDWLRSQTDEQGNLKYDIKEYRGVVGLFFESYIEKIFIDAFGSIPYTKLLLFDDLLIKENRTSKEFSDLYFRQNNRILIGEAKSGNVYDKEKYSGDLNRFYKQNRDSFFKNFGVKQLAESIIELDRIHTLDNKFPIGHRKKIYPVIILNDKIFQTPLMNNLFNEYFMSLIEGKIDVKKNHVYSLALIYIGDLEKMWSKIRNNPKKMWKALEFHSKSKKFKYPFYRTVTKHFGDKIDPKEISTLYKDLIKKYSATE